MIIKQTVYRYNPKSRNHRHFNRLGKEKNPKKIKFYARSLNYANRYKNIVDKDGDVVYEADLEVENIHANLFDMDKDYKSLKTYKYYIKNQIDAQKKDYKYYLENSKTVKDKKFWTAQINGLKNRESELIKFLIHSEFQSLSDFNMQNKLIPEVKKLGYEGYFTKNEIAIF